MISAVLLVNWDDVRDTAPSTHSTPNPALVAQALLKRAGLRAQVSEAHVYGDWTADGGPAVRSAFERCGFSAHPAPAYLVGADGHHVARGHDEVILVMEGGRAASWLQAVPDVNGSTGARTVVWHAGSLSDRSLLPDSADVRPLEHTLHWPALTASGLFVDWGHVEARFRQLSVRLEPEQLVAGLLRCAGLLGEVTNAHLYGATDVAWRNERTVRRQFDVLDTRGGPALRDGILELLSSPASPDTWIMVTDDPCLLEIAAELRERRKRTVLWAVDTPDLDIELKSAADHFVPLQWVLDLRAHRVAVMIDYENVARSLNKQGYSVDPATLARGLAEQAKSFGQVVDSRAYADWDQFLEAREPDGRIVRRSAQRAFREANIETFYVLPGPNSSDVQMARDVEVMLNSPSCPDAFIIASGDGDFCGTIDGIRRQNKEAWVWSVRSATRADLIERASRHDWIEDLLNLNAVERPRSAPSTVTSFNMREVIVRDHSPRDLPINGEDGVGYSRDVSLDREPREQRMTVSADAQQDSRLGSWVRMAYYTEKTLRENRWTKIAFKRLSAMLAEMEEFGPTPANSMMWLNRAKAEGILVTEQEAHRADPTIKVTTCRLNRPAPAVRAALEVPDKAMRLLFQMLQKMPWVSFKLLRSVLSREQWLGGPPFSLDEASIDEWINFLVQDGAIMMAKEPNAENPDFPVTALRLNPEHPMAREIVRQAVDGNRLAAERAILAVDHFLIRSRKPWMAMSALRRNLETLGKDELQQVLQGLQNLGALVTESYPNPQKEHFTTGCYLNSEDNLVREAIQTRNAIIRVTQSMQRYRSWVPLSKLDEELAAELWMDVPQSTRLAWFMLLKDEGILELDHDGPPNQTGWGNIQARLNVADAVVRAVVATETPAPGLQPL